MAEINEPSILVTIKKLLGMPREYTAFDMDLVVHINSVISILWQMGVGPSDGYMITGYDETWDQYVIDANSKLVMEVKTYIYQKVRLLFDPPSNAALMEALKGSINEFEYRLYTQEGGY